MFQIPNLFTDRPPFCSRSNSIGHIQTVNGERTKTHMNSRRGPSFWLTPDRINFFVFREISMDFRSDWSGLCYWTFIEDNHQDSHLPSTHWNQTFLIVYILRLLYNRIQKNLFCSYRFHQVNFSAFYYVLKCLFGIVPPTFMCVIPMHVSLLCCHFTAWLLLMLVQKWDTFSLVTAWKSLTIR